MDTSIRSSNGGPQAPQAPSGDGSSSLEIPDCVTKLEETKGGGKYLCNPCQAHCNSEQQLAQVRTSLILIAVISHPAAYNRTKVLSSTSTY